MKHSETIHRSFGTNAGAYLKSSVHAQGADMEEARRIVCGHPDSDSVVLDLGCGAGHLSYAVAAYAKKVTAYDLSREMLEVVAAESRRRGLINLETMQGSAHELPFDDASYDAVVSRYSAHHWRQLPVALKEVHRILKPGGTLCFIDQAGGSEPLFDTYLQTIEVLRDPSHVRDYTDQEWLAFCEDAGFSAHIESRWRLPIEFSAWIERMRTPPARVHAIELVWKAAPEEVRDAYDLQPDLSFTMDALMVVGLKEKQRAPNSTR